MTRSLEAGPVLLILPDGSRRAGELTRPNLQREERNVELDTTSRQERS